MSIPYYVRRPLDYYDVSTFDNRPYTHKILEKNIPGLAINNDGTYKKMENKIYTRSNGSVYPVYSKGYTFGLATLPVLNYDMAAGRVNTPATHTPSVFEEHAGKTVNPVDLPEVEREEELDQNVKSIEETKREIANRKRAAYNQARGITTAEAYKRQKELRDADYNVTYDGYWGDASSKAWDEYQKKLQQPQTPQMPAQFANIDVMGAIKTEEARKKAELEALMQKQGVGSNLLNTDPHNIQGGYVVPVEPEYDMSKMDTHNQFGFKFYKGGMVPKHQNASGEELKEKPQSISTSGYFLDENGNPVVQNVDMVTGKSKDDKNRWFQRIITQRDSFPADTVMYDFNRRIPIENPDSNAYYNALFEEMLKRSEPIEYKKGGSLKKCSCGCKTLLKRGKGGKVMESRNCK